MMAILLRCKNQAYMDDGSGPRFLHDKSYRVQWKCSRDGYYLINEDGEEHSVGVEGDKWFDKHFEVVI